MKNTLLSIIFAGFGLAAPINCMPDLLHDGIALPLDCFGNPLLATSSSTWVVGLNDNPPGAPNDFDANDLVMRVAFTPLGVATYTFLGGFSSAFNLFDSGGVLFTSLSPVGATTTRTYSQGSVVDLIATTVGPWGTYTFHSGNGSPQYDIQCLSGCVSAAPEVSTGLMMLSGLILAWAGKRGLS
jgi:hypothetical protein